MRIIILVLTLNLINADLFSQGGVDVKYIPIDSVDSGYVGLKVKIDFKSREIKEYIIQKARIRDTATIVINNRLVKLIEIKGTGVDYWYFDKEYLESHDYNPGMILRIKEIQIQKIQPDSILFRMTLDQFEPEKKKLKQISSETQNIWILREKIEGILIKN